MSNKAYIVFFADDTEPDEMWHVDSYYFTSEGEARKRAELLMDEYADEDVKLWAWVNEYEPYPYDEEHCDSERDPLERRMAEVEDRYEALDIILFITIVIDVLAFALSMIALVH